MSTGTAIGLVISFIALIISMFLYSNDQVDKKIKKAIGNPSVLAQLAKQIQLPFIIIDEEGVYRYELNTQSLIEDIKIDRNEENEIKSITIIPKEMLDAPPIVEAINFGMAFAEPQQVKPFSWIFYPAEENSLPFQCKPDQEPDPTKKLVKQFKITLIKREK